jgi:hypothetical protein
MTGVAVPPGTALHRGDRRDIVEVNLHRVAETAPYRGLTVPRDFRTTPDAVAISPGTALHRCWAAGWRGILPLPRRGLSGTALHRRFRNGTRILFGARELSRSLRGPCFIEAPCPGERGARRGRVAVAQGTALHRGGPTQVAMQATHAHVAVPPGTALHRGTTTVDGIHF